MRDIKMKIAIVAISAINNIGEDLLLENTKFLSQKIFSSADFKLVEIAPDKKHEKGYRLNNYIADRINALSHHCHGYFHYILKKWSIYTRYSSYYKNSIKDTDVIIYAFGMLKYSTQDANYLLYTLNFIAEKLNIPVFMNAMSIQKYDPADFRAKNLIEACTKKCVRMITTRDGAEELDELNRFYCKNIDTESSISTSIVGDVALWTPEAFHLPRKANTQKIKTVGINVINLKQFQIYGNNITEKDIITFYKNIISSLTQKGYDYYLFCNGMNVDYDAGKFIIEALHLPKDKLLNIVKTIHEYVQMLCNFDCVIAARLHASIICYTFNIPVISPVWDNKIRAFYKKINRPMSIIEPDDLLRADIINMLEEAVLHPYEETLFEELKTSTLQSFKDFPPMIH